ncbi:MAG TPA: dihydrofolate reductase family protein [Candidatus Woesebacteria bacterium]|nr:dihydrofolate reductase family protein [Candidatus Woesebacteria bacterium]
MNKPEVILLAAMSIDGFIAPLNQEHLSSTTWTSQEDRQFFAKKSKAIGTMIMGSKTFLTIGKALMKRKTIVMTSQPARFANFSDPNLLFTADNPEKILTDLNEQGIKQVALCGGASIYNLFLQKGLIDRMFLTIEPFIFGSGVKFVSGSVGQIQSKFILVSQEKLNDAGTLVLEFKKA